MTLILHTCPLCHSKGKEFYSPQFQKCSGCQSVFKLKEYFISPIEEQTRYEEHNNDITDEGYQDFVNPMVTKILENHDLKEDWLDFGAGTGPVISYLLWQKWYKPKLYDPYFHNHPELLRATYDYIIACEVVEHFYNPRAEFKLLYNLLKPNGKLYIMTDMYSPEIDFNAWYYKNDKTHVFFYSHQAFIWIQQAWPWKSYSRNKRCIILEK